MALSKRPLSRAEKVERTPSLQCSNCIAAIDFGTSSVSLAYTTPLNKGDVQALKLHRTYERVPNAVLFQYNEGQYLVQEIGQQAQTAYSKLRPRMIPKYVYFERIRKILDESINRDTTVPSFTGGSYYLLEVIAFIMTYLKERLLKDLKQEYKCSDFDWVITVPAIWKARARRMMREAAYLAALTSDHGGITKFTDTSRGTLPRPLEVNPHKLTLALEPEAAAIYAHRYSHMSSRPPPDRYMVVDVGGGTVDITVHSRRDGKIDVILPPIGNTWGGTTVNEAFRHMIEEDLVQDKKHQNFLQSRPTAVAILNKLYYEEFEKEKKNFGKDIPTPSNEVAITLPPTFVEFYSSQKLEERADRLGMKFEEDEEDSVLYIRHDQLEHKIFKTSMSNIIAIVKEALSMISGKINTIYLVGGFGGSTYVKRSFEEALASDRGKVYDQIVCPQQADLAVTIGAVLWRQDPDIIQSRIADATYGIGVAPIFDPSIHDKHYRYVDEDGTMRCNFVFKKFIVKGEPIEKKVYKIHLMPLQDEWTTMTLLILSTTKEDVQYTYDKEQRPTVNTLAELSLDISNQQQLPKNQRLVEISIDFSGTEIQASAKYQYAEKEIKIVCDFLTFQEHVYQ